MIIIIIITTIIISGKETVTGVQVVTACKVSGIGGRPLEHKL